MAVHDVYSNTAANTSRDSDIAIGCYEQDPILKTVEDDRLKDSPVTEETTNLFLECFGQQAFKRTPEDIAKVDSDKQKYDKLAVDGQSERKKVERKTSFLKKIKNRWLKSDETCEDSPAKNSNKKSSNVEAVRWARRPSDANDKLPLEMITLKSFGTDNNISFLKKRPRSVYIAAPPDADYNPEIWRQILLYLIYGEQCMQNLSDSDLKPESGQSPNILEKTHKIAAADITQHSTPYCTPPGADTRPAEQTTRRQ